jgi:hypothetical protein
MAIPNEDHPLYERYWDAKKKWDFAKKAMEDAQVYPKTHAMRISAQKRFEEADKVLEQITSKL